MAGPLDGAILAALIAAAVSFGIFAATQVIGLVPRISAGRRARVDAVLAALAAVILEARSPVIVRLYLKTQVRLLLAVTEMVGALPPRDRPLMDYMFRTSQRIAKQTALRRVECASEGLGAVQAWFGNRRNGRSFTTARLIDAKQVSLFGSKPYDEKLPRGVRQPKPTTAS